MEPIYNQQGQVIGWQNDSSIYHLNGTHATLINGDNVYGEIGQSLDIFKGSLLGSTEAGWSGLSRGLLVVQYFPFLPFPPTHQYLRFLRLVGLRLIGNNSFGRERHT